MNPQLLIACALALAVLVGSGRLLWRTLRAPSGERPRAWRTLALLLVQVAGAALLYCTLFPPPVPREAGTLVVLGARADAVDAPWTHGEHVVALPEADAPASVERAPDLATALRRYSATERIRVVGAGLPARDRDAVDGRALGFVAAPPLRGLAELQAPAEVATGRQFPIIGRAEQLPRGTAELLDPAGNRIARVRLDQDGRFALRGIARTPGLASYRLRLRDAQGQQVEDAAIPLEVLAGRALRVLVMAGAPNAEVKYLRRWALDAGMSVDSRISLGGGLEIGGASTGGASTGGAGLDAALLAELDLLVLDERSWQALGSGQRRALSTAIDEGLGVLLRLTTAPTGADRQRLRELGFTSTPARAGEVRLGGDLATSAGSTDAQPDADGGADDAVANPPGVTRSAVRIAATDGVTLVEDDAGAPLAVWRAQARGRIGVSTLSDTFRLVLAGHEGLHGETWSRLFTVMARARGTRRPSLEERYVEQRVALCELAADAQVVGPGGAITALQVDPRTGSARCAGFWPAQRGWHLLRNGDASAPFHVRAADELPALQARQTAEATATLAASAPAQPPVRSVAQPGSRWPWFLGWLLLTTLGWTLERRRWGIGARANPP